MNDTYIVGKCYVCKEPCGEECFGYSHVKCILEENKKEMERKRNEKNKV